MSRLAGKSDDVSLDAEGAEHHAHRKLLALQHRPLLDVQFEVSRGAREFRNGVNGAIDLDAVFADGVFESDAGLVGQVAHVIRDERCSLDHSLGDAIEVLIRREDAERFLGEVRKDDPELARHLRIIERELDAGSLN